MSFMKSFAKSGADGNTRLLKQYGGSPGSGGPKGYASGGSVRDYDADDMPAKKADGGMVDGDSAKPRMDRPGRKMHGKPKDKAKGGTNVNVIIMPKGDGAPDAAAVGPSGPGPMPMPPHAPMMAGPPPGGPPPMAGGPPMPPMRKSGGAVNAYKAGGKVCKAEGGSVDDTADAFKGAMFGSAADAVVRGAKSASNSVRNVAPSMGKAEGGPVYGKMHGVGAGGGKGREQKIKAYGK
jgi:hypothetical protein